MSDWILLLIWALPLSLVALAGQRHAKWLMLAAPLPALLAAAVLPVGSCLTLPWLLLGVELGVDATGRVFLFFSGLLWLVATLYAAGSQAREHDAVRYRVFFLLAMAGNLGLIVARDMLSFYFGFTLMGLAAYGLIAHPASQHARRAAQRYLAWTIAGELMLLSAIIMLAAQNAGVLDFEVLRSNPPAGLAVLLLIIGFGIKLALPGLHFWLPPAYAVAPPAAVAVLSGAMIKAGLLGWLRYLPPGDAALAGWGQALIIAGAAGMFFGAGLALVQRRPRLVLAYSSISKMGVLTAGMGAALAWPAAAPALIVALALYAAHHALVKGALFLGLGLAEQGGLRPWLLAGIGFLALALAGAPLTSGALAKSALLGGLAPHAPLLLPMLGASAFATALVMARFVYLTVQQHAGVAAPHSATPVTAWLLLLAVIAALPFLVADAGKLLGGAVTLFLAALVAAVVLLSGVCLPARISRGKRRGQCDGYFPHSVLRNNPLSGTAACVSGGLRTLQQRVAAALLRSYRRFATIAQISADSDYRWPLAGSVWLGIAGLLLGALAFTV